MMTLLLCTTFYTPHSAVRSRYWFFFLSWGSELRNGHCPGIGEQKNDVWTQVISNGNLSCRSQFHSHPPVRSQEVVGGPYEEAQPGLGYLPVISPTYCCFRLLMAWLTACSTLHLRPVWTGALLTKHRLTRRGS